MHICEIPQHYLKETVGWSDWNSKYQVIGQIKQHLNSTVYWSSIRDGKTQQKIKMVGACSKSEGQLYLHANVIWGPEERRKPWCRPKLKFKDIFVKHLRQIFLSTLRTGRTCYIEETRTRTLDRRCMHKETEVCNMYMLLLPQLTQPFTSW